MTKIKIPYWELLQSEIKLNYDGKIVFVQDKNLSYFDNEEIPIDPQFYVFDTMDDFLSWEEERWSDENEDRISIINNLSVLYINGLKDTHTIFKLRG